MILADHAGAREGNPALKPRTRWCLVVLAMIYGLHGAPIPLGWTLVVATLGILGAAVKPVAGWSTALGMAIWLYWAQGGVVFDGLSTVIALMAFSVLVADSGGSRLLWCVGGALTAFSVVLVTWVLMRTGWLAEAAALRRLAAGLCWGAIGWLVVRGLVTYPADPGVLSRRRWIMAGLVVLGVLYGGARRSIGDSTDFSEVTLPGWEVLGARVGSPPAGIADGRAVLDTDQMQTLEQLRAAGFRDAAHAWVALALSDNATSRNIRRLCPPSGRTGSLDSQWEPAVALGMRACDALGGWPEAGAEDLLDQSAPVLTRLAGDLLMDAGLVDAAIAAYRRAANSGEKHARRDGVRRLLNLGHRDLALKLVDTSDPLTGLWMGMGGDDAVAWDVWSESLLFDGMSTGWRSGFRSVGVPGELVPFMDPELRGYATMTVTRYANGFDLLLPMTPRRQVPSQMTLHVRVRRGFELELSNDLGEKLLYSCSRSTAAQGLEVVLFPAEVCSVGRWVRHTIEPSRRLRGPLRSMQLRGDYILAGIEAAGGAPGP